MRNELESIRRRAATLAKRATTKGDKALAESITKDAKAAAEKLDLLVLTMPEQFGDLGRRKQPRASHTRSDVVRRVRKGKPAAVRRRRAGALRSVPAEAAAA